MVKVLANVIFAKVYQTKFWTLLCQQIQEGDQGHLGSIAVSVFVVNFDKYSSHLIS